MNYFLPRKTNGGFLKIDRLETHDRLQHFTKQSFDIGECCQDLINKRPFGDHPFYIFAHSRTIGMDEKFKLFLSGQYKTMEEVPEKTIIWQPRLTKPRAQENSMLFKAYPGTDVIKVIWMLPALELWDQYTKGKMMENKTVSESIEMFKTNKEKLEEKEPDDLDDVQIDKIYREISKSAKGSKGPKQNSVDNLNGSLL
jgi:hypothetical protein